SELPLVGGHPALDLVNTVEPRLPAAGRQEHLAAPADLLAWAERAGMITGAEAESVAAAWAAEPGTAVSALASVIRIREALASTLDAILASWQAGPGSQDRGADQGGAAPSQALDYLSLRWGAAMARSRLVPAGRGARLAVGSAAAELIADRAVAAAVSLLCETDLSRLGICPPRQHGCGWLFLDRSKNGSRRWCAMDCCGTHAKAKRLTERRRTVRSRRNAE
ncbi:MAG TPA: CGNR zinc finger domain-containing protein, partial [Streptosporangiaceae bacterium]